MTDIYFHPAYAEGRAAFIAHEKRVHNPYAGIETKHIEELFWLKGWDAEAGNQFDPITLEIDSEISFQFEDSYHHNRVRIKYYYRTPDGRLYMTIADTLAQAQTQKDQWLNSRISRRNKVRDAAEQERIRRETVEEKEIK